MKIKSFAWATDKWKDKIMIIKAQEKHKIMLM